MTEREAELLAAMKRDGEQQASLWFRPLDLGGSGHNHVSKALRRMVPKGWVIHRQRSPGAMERGAYEYQITPRGAQALANHRLMGIVRKGNLGPVDPKVLAEGIAADDPRAMMVKP